MIRRRLVEQAAILLVAAGLLFKLHHALAATAAARLPKVGLPLLSLGMRALSLFLFLAGLWRLRSLLGSAVQAGIRFIDRVEARLFEKLPPRRLRVLRGLAMGLLIGTGTNLLIETTNVEQGLEANFVDRWFNLRFPQRTDAELLTDPTASQPTRRDEVAIVALDDDSIARLGWPLPRYAYARLIDAISAAHPASLSFDIALIDPSRDHPDWDIAVGESAARSGQVYFTYLLAATSREAPAHLTDNARRVLDANTLSLSPGARRLPEFAEIVGRSVAPQMLIDVIVEKIHGAGMANVLLDGGDDILRHSLLAAKTGEQILPSLSLRVAADALGVKLPDIHIYPGSHVDLGGKRRIPIDELGRALVRYQGRHSTASDGPFRYLSMWSLIRADAALTLAQSPMGEDQEYVIDDRTKVAVNGQASTLAALDPARLAPGSWITGVAEYASDPGRILELSVSEKAPAAEPKFEVLDESKLSFATRVRKLRKMGADASSLAGRHVLVGSTALAAADFHNGPLGAVPGVEHHATMLSNILRGDFFDTAPLWSRLLMTMLLALLAALAGSLFSPSVGFVLAALFASALVIGVFLAFGAGLYVPIVAPAASVLLSYGLCVLWSFRAEGQARARAEEGREFVRRTFGRYLTDQVVQEILGSPDGLRLGGQRRFVTIMMTDLRGFTSMCGSMEPENVVKLLNHYLEAMTRIINRYGGTIDEFIGDAILVVFGAPLKHGDEELRAVACAIEMENAMAEVNRWNTEQGLPAVEMGIGIHSGEVVLGNIGSEMRAKYGIVGSTINLTSRVESYTVGGQVLISEATRQRGGSAMTVGSSQTVTPKGVKGTLTIHEALGVGAPYNVELLSAHEELLAPQHPLHLRYATIKEKQVGDLVDEAIVEAISEQGFELRVKKELDALANLLLRLVDENGELRPGDLYGKVLRPNVRPGVIYVRLTSVPPELKKLLEAAREKKVGSPESVLDGPLSSG